MELRSTFPGKDDFGLFEAVPLHVRLSDEPGAGPVGAQNLEFLQECLVAVSDGQPVGRIALYDNPALFREGRKAACLGNYECVDRPEVAQELIQAAVSRLKESGFGFVVAPMNGSIWDGCGFRTSAGAAETSAGFGRDQCYSEQFRSAGFLPVLEQASFLDTEMHIRDPHVQLREAALLEQGVLIRSIRIGLIAEELDRLHPFVNLAFRGRQLYTPVGKEAFRERFLRLSADIDAEMVLVAEDGEGRVIGFIFGLPDGSAGEKRMVVEILARHPDEQWAGLDAVLVERVVAYARRSGYSAACYRPAAHWQPSAAIVSERYCLYGLPL